MIVTDTTDHARLHRARRVTPGASQTQSKAPGKVGPHDCREGFPLFAERGEGAYLYASNGDGWLDFVGANAAIPLGYAHPAVVSAVQDAARTGSLLSLPSALEIEASAELCEAVNAEQVRWVKTGTEAVSAAVRIARAATGASVVIVGDHSYHGWSDWTYARHTNDLAPGSHAFANGVPSALAGTVLTYNYAEHVEGRTLVDAVQYAHSTGARIAAIVIEPHRWQLLQESRLREARRVADETGALLIFDEMVYGFRWAVAGATDYFGVTPDLRCYGKALGNGVPVACVVGAADVMRYTLRARISSTFGGDRLGLAAALAVMRVYRDEPVIARLWQNGRTFGEEFALRAHVSDRMRLIGFPVHFRIFWANDAEADHVLTRCALRGVLFHRDANNASAVMAEAEVRLGARVLAEELHAASDIE